MIGFLSFIKIISFVGLKILFSKSMELKNEQLAQVKRSDRMGKKIGMVVCGIFSVVLMVVSLADTYIYYKARRTWTPTTATVVSKVLQYCGKNGVYSYAAYGASPCWWVGIYYNFDGHPFLPTARWVSDETRFRVDSATRILVNPKDPQDFVFDPPLFSWITYSVVGAVGLLFAYFVFWIYRDIRKQDALDNGID